MNLFRPIWIRGKGEIASPLEEPSMEWLRQAWPVVAVVGAWILLHIVLRKAGVPI